MNFRANVFQLIVKRNSQGTLRQNASHACFLRGGASSIFTGVTQYLRPRMRFAKRGSQHSLYRGRTFFILSRKVLCIIVLLKRFASALRLCRSSFHARGVSAARDTLMGYLRDADASLLFKRGAHAKRLQGKKADLSCSKTSM